MTGSTWVLAVAFGLGVAAGLRTFTAPAVACWGASWGWLHLSGSRLAWMGSAAACWIFTAAALGELVMDKLPRTGSRTAPGPLVGRLLSGGLCGAAACLSAGHAAALGVVLGMVGALAGTFGGYRARIALDRALGTPDWVVALLEDAVAIGGACLLAAHL